MIYGSVCSGIEAASVAWHPLGWRAAFYSEIDPFPCAVLNHYYPTVPNHGDMTKFKEWPDATLDLLVGGTPCQSFSVAGLRKGLDDPRGNLTLVYLAVADKYRPRWLVWENVPGVLSDGTGAFGAFLGGLAELGYGFAYRVLDAQYFGVPQRRRRVFVVGCAGGWHRAAAVLFERHSLQGHPAPRREQGKGTAPTLAARTRGGGGLGTDFDCDGGLVPFADVAPTLNAHFGSKQGLEDQHIRGGVDSLSKCLNAGGMGRQDWETETLIPTTGGGFDVAHSLRADGFDASEDGTGRGTPLVPVGFNARQDPDSWDDRTVPLDTFSTQAVATEVMTLAIRGRGDSHQLETRSDGTANAILTPNGGRAGIGVGAVAFAQNQRDEVRLMDVAGALAAEPGAKQQTYASVGMQVRRLTPRECERLQGFPDDYTLVEYRKKPAADGPRYKALGNSMAVPVMAWIGRRIQEVEEIA